METLTEGESRTKLLLKFSLLVINIILHNLSERTATRKSQPRVRVIANMNSKGVVRVCMYVICRHGKHIVVHKFADVDACAHHCHGNYI